MYIGWHRSQLSCFCTETAREGPFCEFGMARGDVGPLPRIRQGMMAVLLLPRCLIRFPLFLTLLSAPTQVFFVSAFLTISIKCQQTWKQQPLLRLR